MCLDIILKQYVVKLTMSLSRGVISVQTSGWIFTALSRVRRLEGLFLSSKIDFKRFVDGLKKTTADLATFDRRMEAKIPKM